MKAYRDPRCMGTAFTATDDSFWPDPEAPTARPAGPLTEVDLPRADPQQHHGLLRRKGGHIDQRFDALVAVGRVGTRPRPSRFITESGVTRRNGRSRDFGHLAVANAIFAGTGKRLRKMPIDTTVLKRPV